MHLRPTRFDARVDALARHRRYRPIEGVQGFTRSHWTPLSGEYSLRIAPDRQRGRMPKKKRRKSTILVGRFARTVGAQVRNQAHRPTEEVQGYPESHWSTPPGEYGGRYIKTGHYFPFFFEFFSLSTRFSAGQDDVKAPNNIGV